MAKLFLAVLLLGAALEGDQVKAADHLSEFPIYRVTVNDPSEGQVALITFLSPAEIEAIGGLPPQIVVGRQIRMADDLTPDNFGRNRAFVDFLHEVICETVPKVPDFVERVRAVPDGWFNIQDGRTTLQGQPLPPEDLVGRYRVSDGEFVHGEYKPNTGYWVLTENGITTLHPMLISAVLEAMRSLEFAEDSTEPSN